MSNASGASKRRTTVSPRPGSRPASSRSMTCDDQRTNTCSHSGRTEDEPTFSIGREEAVEHAVAPYTLERHVGAQQPLAHESAALGDPLGGHVVRPTGELQPRHA